MYHRYSAVLREKSWGGGLENFSKIKKQAGGDNYLVLKSSHINIATTTLLFDEIGS